MLALLVLIVFGIGVAIFATQNTQISAINLGNYTLANVPVYFLVLLALLMGIFISWIISLLGSITSSLTIYGKDTKIKKSSKEIDDLNERIHDLELENTKLQAELDRLKNSSKSTKSGVTI